MTFRIATCEFPDQAYVAEAMWRQLEDEFAATSVAGIERFWAKPDFDETAGVKQ